MADHSWLKRFPHYCFFWFTRYFFFDAFSLFAKFLRDRTRDSRFFITCIVDPKILRRWLYDPKQVILWSCIGDPMMILWSYAGDPMILRRRSHDPMQVILATGAATSVNGLVENLTGRWFWDWIVELNTEYVYWRVDYWLSGLGCGWFEHQISNVWSGESYREVVSSIIDENIRSWWLWWVDILRVGILECCFECQVWNMWIKVFFRQIELALAGQTVAYLQLPLKEVSAGCKRSSLLFFSSK